ncbi:hypothetical protein NDU88_003911 [Pleurodeles waltl]|uniref:Uncharacterized protein n=1 Tax=Pleurodeles waltl TaxID=8319 RepID=A0AAV7KW96_PLEWA|nr:hypothetical protein NDU88_003911 [Pleurodeles waltl]
MRLQALRGAPGLGSGPGLYYHRVKLTEPPDDRRNRYQWTAGSRGDRDHGDSTPVTVALRDPPVGPEKTKWRPHLPRQSTERRTERQEPGASVAAGSGASGPEGLEGSARSPRRIGEAQQDLLRRAHQPARARTTNKWRINTEEPGKPKCAVLRTEIDPQSGPVKYATLDLEAHDLCEPTSGRRYRSTCAVLFRRRAGH